MARRKATRPAATAPPCSEVQGGCEISELFRLVGKTHVLDILHLFIYEGGPRRFVDIQNRLALSPNTLSERLKELVSAGILTRTAYNEIPPRVDYQATQKALNLKPVFTALQEWAEKNDLKPAAATAEEATA